MYEALVARVRYHIQKANFMGLKEAESTLLLGEAADAIEELSAIREEQKAQIIAMAAEESRWIPVTERLPEEDEEVLVVAVNDFNKDDRWAAIDWLYCGTWQQHSIVTHWMPLPAPPKEET